MTTLGAHCIVDNDSGDKFFIPYGRQQEWNEWMGSEDVVETPEYATLIDGGTLIFDNPRIVRSS